MGDEQTSVASARTRVKCKCARVSSVVLEPAMSCCHRSFRKKASGPPGASRRGDPVGQTRGRISSGGRLVSWANCLW